MLGWMMSLGLVSVVSGGVGLVSNAGTNVERMASGVFASLTVLFWISSALRRRT